jgi:hypothetical protein
MNKRGELTTKEIIEIVLGGAATLLLIVLLYSLIAPNFDRDDEVAKSYFNSFEDAVAVADDGETGSFSMWMPAENKKDKEYFLIYFGAGVTHKIEGNHEYTSFGDNINHICICYFEDIDICGYCRNLNYPVTLSGVSDDKWAVAMNEEIEIIKSEDVYEIKKV